MHILTCAAKGLPVGNTTGTCDRYFVADAKGRDHHAYAERCPWPSKQLLGTAQRITRHIADAEDALQDHQGEQ